MSALLDIRDLRIEFRMHGGTVEAVRGLDLTVEPGQRVALVGESGSGKSVTASAVLGLLESNARITSGSIQLDRVGDVVRLRPDAIRRLRGSSVALVPQDAMTALDPAFPVGSQLVEVLRAHRPVSRRQAEREAIDVLERVGLPEPERRLRSYPHELSGGQRQRVVIAMALICAPRLIIADEPTTALDATVQKQVLDLLRRISTETGTAILMITHDFGVVAHLCERAAVMRHGVVVEEGPTAELLGAPAHPYTQALIRSVPRVGSPRQEQPRRLRRLPVFGGDAA